MLPTHDKIVSLLEKMERAINEFLPFKKSAHEKRSFEKGERVGQKSFLQVLVTGIVTNRKQKNSFSDYQTNNV